MDSKRSSGRFRLLFLIVCVSAAATAGAQNVPAGPSAGIHGCVLDAESRDPVPRTDISLVGTSFHATSDDHGCFAFRGVAPGTYTLRATRSGYEALTREALLAEGGADVELELLMPRKYFRLKAITVTPGTYSFMKTDPTAHQTMSREEIESTPQLGEDVFRAVSRLPGLSSGDYAAHFSVRGGRHDETLILLDGLELYEPYHLKDFNEGAISIVDAETIEGIQLMTGGFPALYGNKRSGVFDITSRTVELDHARYSAGLSLMNARAMARGPLWGGRGSWLTSARSGYMDLVFNLIHQNDLPSPRYQDAFAKLQFRLNENHRLAFDALYAGDRYKFDAAATTGFQDSIDTREDAHNRYGNSYAWTTLQSTLGPRLAVRTLVSGSLVTRSRDGSERIVPSGEPLYTLTNERDFSILGFKQDWTLGLSDADVLSLGVDARRLHATDDFTSDIGADPDDPTQDSTGVYPVTTRADHAASGTTLALVLSNRLRVVDPVVLEVGGRYDRASHTRDRDFSPRTGAAVSLGGGRTLRLGWGFYRQMQGIDDVAVLNRDARYFPSELSEQWTPGVEQLFGDNAMVRVEGYFKEGSHLRPAYRNWKNGIDTFPETNEDRILVFPKGTTIHGLELSYERKLSSRFATRASYAYSVGEEEVDRIESVNTAWPVTFDRKHPIPQDQRHAANVDFTYRWRRLWSINGSLAFHTGWPATLETLLPVTDQNG